MKTLLELPAELRHEILLSALPDEITVAPDMASPLVAFKLVCKQFMLDLEGVSARYNPNYVIAQPGHLACVHGRQRNGIDEIRNVTLSIFSTLR